MTAADQVRASPRYRDLRDWLGLMEEMGEVRVVHGAHWNLEIGAICELNYRRKPSKVLLFDDIVDYSPGFRLVTGTNTTPSRAAFALSLPQEVSDAGLVEALRGKPGEWEREAGRFAPRVVSDAPLFEHVQAGSQVDITRFPAPQWHSHDGGRYLGTGHAVITRDPETGWVNLGAYRMMLAGPSELTLNIVPGRHGQQHYQKWFRQEGRAPVAVSFGHDPLLTMLAGVEVPTGTSEYGYAGAIRGEPLDVVIGEVTGLPIPASSELAVEGFIYEGVSHHDGPFGEWMGYYTGRERLEPLFKIERLYHRTDPILIGSPPSKPPHDYGYMRTVMKSAMIQDALVKAGVPGVKMVWAPECGGGRLLVIVSIQQRFCGHSRQAGIVAAQVHAAAYMLRYIIVVDEDIDPTNLDQVIWAVATRSDPATDVEIAHQCWGTRADPLLPANQPPYNSRAVIDACVPFERIGSFPRVAEASPETLASIGRKWSSLFAD